MLQGEGGQPGAQIVVRELPGRGGLGRGVVAAQPLRAGQLILKQAPGEGGAAWVLDETQVAVRCDHCAGICDPPLRCSRCKHSRYCCRDHQRAAWAAHREECAALAAARRAPPPTVRLLARLLWQRHRGHAAGGGGGSFAAVEGLLHHWEQLEGGRKVAFAQMAALTREFMRDAGGESVAAADAVDVRSAALLLARLACNGHTLCDEELRPYGVGLFPLGAMVNHGEEPNAMQSFKGAAIEFRALRDIAAGEEVTIAYVERAAPRLERRSQLLHSYHFDIDGGPSSSSGSSSDGCNGNSNMSSSGEPASSSDGDNSKGKAAAGSGQQQGDAAFTAADLRLWGAAPGWSQQLQPAACSSSNSSSSSGADGEWWLHCFGRASRPPWREDAADAAMCEVVLAGSGGSGGGGGGVGQRAPLPGGLMMLAAAGGGEDALDALGPAAASFGLGQAADDEEEGAAAEGSGAGSSGSGQTAPEASAAARTHILQWGDWAAAAGAGASGAQARVAAAARQVVHVCRLQARAEALTKAGQPGAAADALLAALRAGGCLPSRVVAAAGGPVSPPSPAAPGGVGEACTIALGPRHALTQRLLAALLNAAVSCGDRWPLALAAGEALVPCYEAAYPAVWPNRGLHAALVAKLQLLLERPRDARASAERAIEVLKVTHASSSVLDEVLRLRHDAEQELAAAAAARLQG